jgi:hypothetical protein
LVSDEHYVLLCLDLANWREGDVPDVANVAFHRVTSNTAEWSLRWATIRTDPSIPVEPRALELGAEIRDVLKRLVESRGRDVPSLSKRRDTALPAVTVATTGLYIEGDVLEHEHGYVAGTGDGPIALLLAFALDPKRRFRKELRRCQLASCGRYFVVPQGRKGGRIQDYCPGTDHQRQADKLRAPSRAKRARTQPRKPTRHK